MVWPRDQEKQRRQIGQASAFVQVVVADLAKRGWLFRPAELARLVTDQLDHVPKYQRTGAVVDRYKYLERAWDKWAGRNAEELAQAAREYGVHRAHIKRPQPPSIAEITLRNLEARDQEIKADRALRTRARRARQPRGNDPAAPLLPGLFQPFRHLRKPLNLSESRLREKTGRDS